MLGDNGSGAISVTKKGSGSWTLQAANSYSGGTLIEGGTLKAGTSSAFGLGGIIISAGATLNKNGFTITNPITNNGGTIIN